MKIMSMSAFASDLYRYYGDKGEGIKNRLLRPIELNIFMHLEKPKKVRIYSAEYTIS